MKDRFFNLYTKALCLGCICAVVGAALSWILANYFSISRVNLAGDKIFAQQNPLQLFFLGVIFSPAFETMVGQCIPVAIAKKITSRKNIWILSGAAIFSLGHVLSGGGIVQACITFVMGAIFTWFYVDSLVFGGLKAFTSTYIVHATNNFALLTASSYF